MELIRVIKTYPKVLVGSLDNMFLRHHYFYPPAKFVPSTLGALVDIEKFCNVDVDLITDFSGWEYLSPAKGNKPLNHDSKRAIIEFPRFLDKKIQQQKLYIESLVNEDSAWRFKSMVISGIINQLESQRHCFPPPLSYLIIYRKRWRSLLEVGILIEKSKNQHLTFEDQEKWIPEIPKFFNKDLGDKYVVLTIPGFFHVQNNWIKSFLINLEDPKDKIKTFILENNIDTKIDLT